ncbi:MAG: hypothetical protein IPJ94_27900 [Chloroflexi bacterium]|nr:hypothetical protein [Chloroflexota bacterium]
MNVQQDYRSYLRNSIELCFSKEELQALCFDLNVDYDNLRGETKSLKISELISHLERRELLNTLVRICSELRPNRHWGSTPRTLLQNVIKDYQNTQKSIEDAIDFVERLFPHITHSIVLRKIIEILDRLINFIEELGKAKDCVSKERIIETLYQFIAEQKLHRIDHDPSDSTDNDYEFDLRFDDRDEALEKLKQIAEDRKRIFRTVFKRIHPDRSQVTKALGDTCESDRLLREQLTAELTRLLQGNEDDFKVIMGLFDIIHKAGIAYSEIGISDIDVLDVAQGLQNYNALERQQRLFHETLENYGLETNNEKASIAKIKTHIERNEKMLSRRIIHLKVTLDSSKCFIESECKNLFEEILQVLEQEFEVSIKR